MRSVQKLMQFKRDLAQQLNHYGLDNMANTPDFILADVLFDALMTYIKVAAQNASWHGILQTSRVAEKASMVMAPEMP